MCFVKPAKGVGDSLCGGEEYHKLTFFVCRNLSQNVLRKKVFIITTSNKMIFTLIET